MMIDKRLINTVADSKKMDWYHGVVELGGVSSCRVGFSPPTNNREIFWWAEAHSTLKYA